VGVRPELWSGDLGGRVWPVRLPDGATLGGAVDDEDDPAPDGPQAASQARRVASTSIGSTRAG
jgi:hypothetical protein